MWKMRKNENDFLRKAKKGKNDEFYTQLEDIEKEIKSLDVDIVNFSAKINLKIINPILKDER